MKNRDEAKSRIDCLKKVNANVKFIYIKHLKEDLGTIDLTDIHSVIVAGNLKIDMGSSEYKWLYEIKKQCSKAGTSFLIEQKRHSWAERVVAVFRLVDKMGKACNGLLHFNS